MFNVSLSASFKCSPGYDPVLLSSSPLPLKGALSRAPSPYFVTPCIPNNPLKPKPLLVCQSVPCKCAFERGYSEVCVCVCVTYQLSVAECVFCDAVAEVLLQLLLLYLYLRSLPPARAATLLTMSRPSTDSIWSDLRKRTGTITLFSFFRWVPSERRKEGRGEEVKLCFP